MLYKWDIIGHQRQLSQLEKEVDEGNISHAYLFSGPGGVGKFHIARIFATILQCPNQYCRSCKSCDQIRAGIHPDVLIMRDRGETIKIDDVRALIQKTNLTSHGARRLVVIENVERMPVEAQNSFLKTLEEPPGNTIFLLTSNRSHEVAETIKSRVRQYSFFSVDEKTLKDGVAHLGESSDLEEVIHMAQGRPRLAIRLLKNASLLQEFRKMYHQIEFFLSRNDLSAKFRFVEELDKNPDQMVFFFDAFFRYLRKLLHEYTAKGDHPLKTRFSLEDISDLFESLTKTRYLIDRNINKKLALENFFLQTER